ncbi:MAG: FAD-dependent oxidoreductase [Betaproteobacteria bacterium]|nr:FAD-dependent oxidoreductase [Betaproteobacteria bacterium]
MKGDLEVSEKGGAATEARAVAEYIADVVVVGGGGSGLAAAIEATTLGREVILVEKNPELGGSTILSIGSFSATCTPHQIRKGIKDNPQDHFEDCGKFNEAVKNSHWRDFHNEDNLALRRILVYNAGDTLRWLESMGVRFFGPTLETPHRKPRMHNVLPNSRAYGYWLAKRARALGVDLRTRRRATRLLSEGRRVVGVECVREDGALERYRARGGVVLSCGDFSAGEELKRRYARPELVTMKTSCNPANTGDGHLMAMELGARVLNSHMAVARIRFIAPPLRTLVHVLPPWRMLTKFMELSLEYMPAWLLRPFIMSFLTTVLEAQPSLYKHGAILVNKRGERFCDELDHPEFKLAEQPDHHAYIVFDDRLAKKYSKFPHFVSTAPGVAYAYVPDYQRSRRDVFHKAPTIEALARKMGVDPLTLVQTIGRRNASLAAEMSKGETASDTLSIEVGPFYAMGPVSCFVKGTDGGLAINEQFQILGENEEPIPGLFGAGVFAQGGMMLEGHGHHIGWAFTSGRLAGRNAAYLANTE